MTEKEAEGNVGSLAFVNRLLEQEPGFPGGEGPESLGVRIMALVEQLGSLATRSPPYIAVRTAAIRAARQRPCGGREFEPHPTSAPLSVVSGMVSAMGWPDVGHRNTCLLIEGRFHGKSAKTLSTARCIDLIRPPARPRWTGLM